MQSRPYYLLDQAGFATGEPASRMNMAEGSDRFYGGIPVFRGFGSLMDPALYSPLPDDWSIGVADIVESTKAIAEARYKAVNMAGASVIAAVTNALEGREFPFVFGGDGASFAVSPDDLERAREALAATATWVEESLNLVMRVALVPVAAIRAQGLDVRVARFGPSPNLSYAMFSGGGLGWAEAAMKRGEFAVPVAPSGHAARSDRAVLPVRGNSRGARPHPLGAGGAGAGCRSRGLSQADRRRRSRWSSAVRMPGGRCRRAGRRCDGRRPASISRRAPRAADRCSSGAPRVLAHTLFAYLVMRFGISVGGFVPKTYVQQVVENSDFRKYDDGLRMILDCTPELERALTQRLAAAAGTASRAMACTGRTRR